MNWYLSVIKQYVNFNGRARRKEFWFFMLFNFLISIILMILDAILGTLDPQRVLGGGIINGLYSLFVFLPSLAVTVRRLHDTDRSGWWVLISFIPLIGGIVLFIFMLFDGTQGINRFGVNPKNISIEGPLAY